jgi:hypothetical protein
MIRENMELPRVSPSGSCIETVRQLGAAVLAVVGTRISWLSVSGAWTRHQTSKGTRRSLPEIAQRLGKKCARPTWLPTDQGGCKPMLLMLGPILLKESPKVYLVVRDELGASERRALATIEELQAERETGNTPPSRSRVLEEHQSPRSGSVESTGTGTNDPWSRFSQQGEDTTPPLRQCVIMFA